MYDQINTGFMSSHICYIYLTQTVKIMHYIYRIVVL